MADGFVLALQKGLRAALVANSDVTDLVSTRVYDEPPQDVVFPYLRFGEITPVAFDTDTLEGSLVSVSLEANSRSASGRVEAARIIEAVKAALHRQETAVTVTGFTLVELIFQTFSVTRDAEGRGYTAVIALQAMLEEIA
ncbi:MAG: DUF3168 domain-containing protein [Lentibacter algarum]